MYLIHSWVKEVEDVVMHIDHNVFDFLIQEWIRYVPEVVGSSCLKDRVG
jgi:hypothetical protein